MMQKIGQELHENTGAFETTRWSPRILDMCMAPGGFLSKALELNPGSRATAFSLPTRDGGHKVLLQKKDRVKMKFLDITMLAADMGVMNIPTGHEDADNFLPAQFEPNEEFDIVLCDGQVLRTQSRASYRDDREATRLICAQLVLGLEHLRKGGTMIVLMHKAEAWDTVLTLRSFSTFSNITLYKPKKAHTKRSSFYLIAKDIDSKSPEGISAVKEWKEAWRLATFETGQEREREIRANDPPMAEVLEKFGPKLISLGTHVWKVQADSLAEAPFVKNAPDKPDSAAAEKDGQ
ncbi:hypothetical protein IMZ48_46915 [Candidatus Bathyarchaeota archaeon]|nr:hypothetical protein [Candidatus Bathyarchaeota archaeon]